MLSPILILAFGGGLAFILLMVGIVISVSGDRKNSVEERIDRYTSSVDMDYEETGPRTNVLADWMTKRVEKTSFGDRISRELTRADLKLKSGEYIITIMLSAVVVGILARLEFQVSAG
ncbi:MAG TPA: hypothetical protein VFF68_05665, partial [Anaerolineaceae bacterium]|nr:hypothetical protein [Anaerolineaceae bacterium]